MKGAIFLAKYGLIFRLRVDACVNFSPVKHFAPIYSVN